MKHIILPDPPNPADTQYRDNPLSLYRAQYDWARKMQSIITSRDRINTAPCGQPIQAATAFTTSTVLGGTYTATGTFTSTTTTTTTTTGTATSTVTNTYYVGVATGTDIANWLSSLVASLTSKGLIAPTHQGS